MNRRNFIGLSGAGLLAGTIPVPLVGAWKNDNIRWERITEQMLFSQVKCSGKNLVTLDGLGVLNASCTILDKGNRVERLNLFPGQHSVQKGALKAELEHKLFTSGLTGREDLLRAALHLFNGGRSELELDIRFTTGARPAGESGKQGIYLPISSRGLARDKRMAELGSLQFYQDCELYPGEEEFSCHYLEPMASYPEERMTKALLLAPVVDMFKGGNPWRVALFTPSEQPYRFRMLRDLGEAGWEAGRKLRLAPGEELELQCFLLIHDGLSDRAWDVFHRSAHVDEFQPPDWLREVRVHYYDFLSAAGGKNARRGDGYDADLPYFREFHVGLATQHGYYPYIGDFIDPDRHTWQAMATDPAGAASMSLALMKERINATKARGAHAAVYMHTVLFDDASPLFEGMRDSVLVGADGERKNFTWKGPDTVGQNWWMSFASKDWTDHLLEQAGYIMEILDPDAIVFDETFVCLGYEHHPDRSGPLSVHSIPFWKEMRRLIHSFGSDKALITSDCAGTNMVMWADGDGGDHSYEKTLGNPLYRKEPIRYKAALGDKPWVPCSWHFLKMWEPQMDLARKLGTAVGVSNGWIEYNGLHGLDEETAIRLKKDIQSLF